MKKLAYLSALILLNHTALSYEFEAYKIKQGDWITKLLVERGYFEESTLEATLNKNSLTNLSAKKIAIGEEILLPKIKTQSLVVQTIPNQQAANQKSSVNQVTNTVDEKGTEGKSDRLFGSIEAGAFYQEQSLQNYTVDLNANYGLALTFGKRFFESSENIPAISTRIWGEFLDDSNLKATPGVELDPNFGIDFMTRFSVIDNSFDLIPSLGVEEVNHFTETSQDAFFIRKDRNILAGLKIEKKIRKVRAFASVKQILANDRYEVPEGLNRLKGQKYGVGLGLSFGDIETLLYHNHVDFEGTQLRKSQAYGLNLGYNFY